LASYSTTVGRRNGLLTYKAQKEHTVYDVLFCVMRYRLSLGAEIFGYVLGTATPFEGTGTVFGCAGVPLRG
jgi:hypothetical protein